jgi:hypothetical protein
LLLLSCAERVEVFGIGSAITVLSGFFVTWVGVVPMVAFACAWVLAATVASWLFARAAVRVSSEGLSVQEPLVRNNE